MGGAIYFRDTGGVVRKAGAAHPLPISDSGAVQASTVGQPGGPAGPLDQNGEIPIGQIPIDGLNFQGAWDASTNTPTLADGTGTAGDMYRVSVAGTQDLGSGPLTFAVGDHVIYEGTTWQQFSPPPAMAWGDITGTLSNQTDLQAALDGKLDSAGGTVTGQLIVLRTEDHNKIALGKQLGSSRNAPTTYDKSAVYLQIGLGEFDEGSYRLIALGWRTHGEDNHPPGVIGYQEISSENGTNGRLLLATRPTNNDVATTIRLTIEPDGTIDAKGNTVAGVADPTAEGHAANKGYVDIVGGNFTVATHSDGSDLNLQPTSDKVWLVDASAASGTQVVNLPDATGNTPAGKPFIIKKTDSSANALSIVGGEGNIDGNASIGISDQYGMRHVVFDGTNWQIIGTIGS